MNKMTKVILEQITNINDLLLFSKAYKEGLIKVNISKLAKELNKDRKTIKKYLNGETPKRTRVRVKYLDEYREYIVEVLSDKHQSFDYIDHLFKFLKREKNITCSRTSLNRYIREDMKLIDKDGNVISVTIPTLTLSWSRYNVRKMILDTKTDELLSFLAESFEEIGGVPHELVIDNLKQFVEKPRYKDSDALLTNKLIEFAKDYNIKIKPCMPYRPQTKGKTETQNKIVDQLKNYNGKYKDIYDMHEKLAIIHNEDNNNIYQATKFPRKFLLEKEKGDLNPLPSKKIREKYHLSLNEVHVSNESLISYKSNKYSVPRKFIGLKVGLVVKRDDLHIYYKGKIITIHKISNNLLNIKESHDLKYKKEKEKM